MRDKLRVAIGPIRDTRRLNAINQFVLSYIGSKTYDRASLNAFLRLVRHFRSWETLADAPVAEIESLLAGVTYPEKKAPDLKRALQKIRVRASAVDLEFLADHPVEQALRWLEEIYGVGRKIAAATVNFSALRKRAFVADTHVLRVLPRFGFVRQKANEIAVFDAVMEAAEGFDADDLYELHWYLKIIGQKICRPFHALCPSCPLSGICMKRIEEREIAQSGRAA
jgi:endonuclease-3